ncbi:tRNA (guanosine(18)-2'-O)-methyltransferase [compost metagenome]
MGSLLRVGFTELTHEHFLTINNKPIYATSLAGKNIKKLEQRPCGVIAMGNEGRGLSEVILQSAQYQIMIPRVGGAESLNVSVAAGIICSELILG